MSTPPLSTTTSTQRVFVCMCRFLLPQVPRSVNEIVCHGIPDDRPFEDGDIVNLDVTIYKDGYHGDVNETYLVGHVKEKYVNLVKAAYESLRNAIKHGMDLKESPKT